MSRVWHPSPRYTRTQWLALLLILVPVLVFGVIFYVDSSSPFALVGAVLVWVVIVGMFGLRWWCVDHHARKLVAFFCFVLFCFLNDFAFFLLDDVP
jgi:hypothetical protein